MVALPGFLPVNEATSVLRVLAIAVVLEVSFVSSAKADEIVDLIFFSDGEPPSFRLRFFSNGLPFPFPLPFYLPPSLVALYSETSDLFSGVSAMNSALL